MDAKYNLEKSSAAKVSKHIPSRFSMSSIYFHFQDIENKRDVYRGKNYIKHFHECLQKHRNEIISFKKKSNEVINR